MNRRTAVMLALLVAAPPALAGKVLDDDKAEDVVSQARAAVYTWPSGLKTAAMRVIVPELSQSWDSVDVTGLTQEARDALRGWLLAPREATWDLRTGGIVVVPRKMPEADEARTRVLHEIEQRIRAALITVGDDLRFLSDPWLTRGAAVTKEGKGWRCEAPGDPPRDVVIDRRSSLPWQVTFAPGTAVERRVLVEAWRQLEDGRSLPTRLRTYIDGVEKSSLRLEWAEVNRAWVPALAVLGSGGVEFELELDVVSVH